MLSETVKDRVIVETRGPVRIITINRPDSRNSVDGRTARRLFDTFAAFESDATAFVAILTGRGGCFCAGADLKALSAGDEDREIGIDGLGSLGPMGPTRMRLSKPLIAAIEGHAVAGGMELALLADLRVIAEDSIFGIFCRRFGVPLIDLGTIRLPRIIGEGRAMDLILTGRPVGASEALRIGLANRVTPPGQTLACALELAQQLAAFPQTCLRSDRLAVLRQWDLPMDEAIKAEARAGLAVLASGETFAGAASFSAGVGRHGVFKTLPHS